MRLATGLDLRRLVMRLLAVGLFVCLVVLAVFVCSPGVVYPRPGLTAEEAKAALVELLRADPTAFQRTFDWHELSKQPLMGRGAGGYTCGNFRISLPGATYQITVKYGCVFEYEGSFQFEGEQWIASKPQWTSAALSE